MSLGSRAARLYLFALGTAFLLAAPFFASGGGYGCITGFKAAVYVVLTGAFLLISLFDLPRSKGFFRSPARLLALGYLFFCLLSAVFSPWQRTAFLGGSRGEGFLHITFYVLSFLLLSVRSFPRRGLLCAFAAALGLQGALCLLQLAGVNALGLYPPSLGWADAGLRYPGAYLGTLGNAGQTGAVLAAGASLCCLRILEKGGRRFLLLPFAALGAFLLSEMDVTGPMLALGAVLLLALPLYGKTSGSLCRWGGLMALVLALLGWKILGCGPALGLTLLAGACFLMERRLPAGRDCSLLSRILLGALCLLAFLLVFTYRGWYAPLREAAALLHGETAEEMGSGRVYIWHQVVKALPQRFWLGSGPDTLGLRGLAPYAAFDPALGREVTLSIDAAHCEYLQTLVCCGPGAALCHLGLAFCAARGFFRLSGTRRACAGAALCYAVQALFGISMCAAAPVFWVLLALSVNKYEEGGVEAEPDGQE